MEGMRDFGRRVINAYFEIVKERKPWAGPYVPLKDIAKKMERKQRYGPWYRKWTKRAEQLRWKSLDGYLFSFAKASGPSKWNIWVGEGRPTMFPGLGWYFLWLLDNEKYNAPPLEDGTDNGNE